MKQIPLTKGKKARVNDIDYDRLLGIGCWSCNNKGYAVHYTTVHGEMLVLYMHRIILDAPAGMVVDHINGDRLDNRRDNLRLGTISQNNANRRHYATSDAPFKGLSWNRGKWQVRIGVNGKRIYLGRFESPTTAALMYDAAARHFYPDFHRCNFPKVATPATIQTQLRDILSCKNLL